MNLKKVGDKGMIYNFDVDVAMKVGVNGAIILSNFKFWIAKNIANNDNFYDGESWTYNSRPAFKKLAEDNGLTISSYLRMMIYSALKEKGAK